MKETDVHRRAYKKQVVAFLHGRKTVVAINGGRLMSEDLYLRYRSKSHRL